MSDISTKKDSPETNTSVHNKGNKEGGIRLLWAGLFLVNVIIAGLAFALVVYQGNLQEVARGAEISATLSADILADGDVTLEDIADVAGRVEAAEERAQFYLSIFESISFWVSMIGIVIVVLGILAAVVGVSNLADISARLELTRKDLEDKQELSNRLINEGLVKVENGRKEAETIKNDLNERFNLGLGRIETRLEEFKEAEKAVKDLETQFLKKYNNVQQAFTLVSLAERDLRVHNIKSAIKTLRQALVLDEANPLAHYYLGVNLPSVDELEASRLHLEAALVVDSNFHHARAALGYTIRRIGEEKEGKERDNDFEEAESCMKLALAHDDNLVDFWGESWYGALGGLYRRQNAIEKAINAYRSAAKITPNSSYPLGNLARLALQGHTTDVVKLYKQVKRLANREISIDGNYWAYSDLLAAQLILGDNTNVLETCTHLIYAIPEDVTDALPRIIETLKDIRQAKKFEDDARDIPTIDEVLKRLQEATKQDISIAGDVLRPDD